MGNTKLNFETIRTIPQYSAKGEESGNLFVADKTKIKGITLIALVLTIVILLILMGITINMLFGENGIITNAQEAAFKSEIAKVDEVFNLYLNSKKWKI